MNLQSFSLKTLLASLLLASTTGFVFAGDSKYEKNYKGDAFVPAPCAQQGLKDGFYVGGQVGHDSYKLNHDFSLTGILGGKGDINATGFVGGLLAGYGRYFNNMYYLGGEIFGNYSGASANTSLSLLTTSNGNAKTSARGSYGLSLLPGIKLNDNTLGYIRLGYNWVSLKTAVDISGSGFPSTSYGKTNTSHGFNYGLGVETLVCDNWSIRTEYSHTDYSSYSTSATVAPTITSSTKVSPSDNQFMLGVVYHFA